MWKKYSESLHRKIKTVQLPQAAVTLLSTYSAAGKQRPWQITRPTRVGVTLRKRLALQVRVARTVRKMKGFRRHPRPKGFKGALTGGQCLPAVGVTVCPKQALAKHKTNKTDKQTLTGQKTESVTVENQRKILNVKYIPRLCFLICLLSSDLAYAMHARHTRSH